jgi:hypothetical protein
MEPYQLPNVAVMADSDRQALLAQMREGVRRLPIFRRPQTRAECLDEGWNASRPCPFVGCRHHLFLDVDEARGSISPNTRLEPWEMSESCVLDVVERHGELSLEDIGKYFGLTRERIRQIEFRAKQRLLAPVLEQGLDVHLDEVG